MYSNKTFSYNPVPLIIVSILGIHNELHVHYDTVQFTILSVLIVSVYVCILMYCMYVCTYVPVCTVQLDVNMTVAYSVLVSFSRDTCELLTLSF